MTRHDMKARELATLAADEFYDNGSIENATRSIKAALAEAEREALEKCARLHESINPASDDERIKGHPGAGAMGAVIEYRDAIRALKGSASDKH